MNSVQFTCNMCGEAHNKLLPLSTDLTACHRCGNLVDISSQQIRNRRRSQRNQNLYNENNNDNEEYNLGDEILGPELDDDFYNFDRYESHEDYLPSPNRLNPRFNRNINNNNDNRPFVRVRNDNRNRSNSTGGMFSIQIANDNYDRVSAYHRRSNFGFPNMNNRNRNNINIYREMNNILEDFDLENELDADLELMSIMDSNHNNNNINREIGLLSNLLIQPQKEKIKLKKIKMCKDLYTKNDSGKLEKPTCCICLIPMKIGDDIVLLKCQHLFHFKCLEKWVETKEVCPFCRGKIEFGKIIKKEDNKNNLKKEDKKIEDKKIKKSDIHKDKEKNINYNSLFNKKTKFKK